MYEGDNILNWKMDGLTREVMRVKEENTELRKENGLLNVGPNKGRIPT